MLRVSSGEPRRGLGLKPPRLLLLFKVVKRHMFVASARLGYLGLRGRITRLGSQVRTET